MDDGGDPGRKRPVVSAAVAGLAAIPAGPQLSAALARVALAQLSGYETVLVLRARARQVNHEQAMLLATVDEVLRRSDPGSGRVDGESRSEWFGVDEVRAALVLTRPAAKSLCEMATDLIARLPEVYAAMRSGAVDEPRGRAFSTGTAELRPEHRRAVVAALLPRAPQLTVTQLADEIRKAAIDLDPASFQRRYAKALTRRRVEASLSPDGTGRLTGRNLPAAQVNAAWDRLDAFARKLKQAGHPDPVSALQADLFGALLDGSLAGLNDAQILDLLTAGSPPSQTGGPDRDAGTRAVDGSGDVPVTAVPGVDGGKLAVGDAPPGPGVSAEPAAPVPPPVRGRGMRLVADLGTIAGRNQSPALLLGLGAVTAEVARQVSAAPAAVWRYVLVTPDCTPLDVGVIRARPTQPWSAGAVPDHYGVEVWLQVTPGELTALRDHPPPGWAPVLAEVTQRVAASPGGPPAADPHARFPGAELRRWIQIRDLHCTFPGCRVPAHHSEVDHLHDHARGGLTTDDNLGLASAGCHDAKTRDGWTAYATRPGHIVWRSPLGHEYPTASPTSPGEGASAGVPP